MTYHLLSSHADRLDAELAATHVEEVLEVRAEEVNDEYVVQTLLAEVVNLRHASCNPADSGSVPSYSETKERRTSSI